MDIIKPKQIKPQIINPNIQPKDIGPLPKIPIFANDNEQFKDYKRDYNKYVKKVNSNK